MGEEKLDQSDTDQPSARPPNRGQLGTDLMSNIADFTPEQWEWLKEQSRRFEKDYAPTRSLIPGL